MGFRNHTECIVLSNRLSPNCDFSSFDEGGLAVWHGGGNWGDIWSRDELLLRRLRSIATLANKGKTGIGSELRQDHQDQGGDLQDLHPLSGQGQDEI